MIIQLFSINVLIYFLFQFYIFRGSGVRGGPFLFSIYLQFCLHMDFTMDPLAVAG